MTSDTAWIENASALFAKGTSVTAICRAVGKSETAVRYHLNINGRADRKRELDVLRKLRHRAAIEEGKNILPRPSSPAAMAAVEPRPKAVITLPKVSILASPIDEVKPAFRFAPKTYCRVEKPGVARYRAKHAEMLRAGKVAGPDIMSELHS